MEGEAGCRVVETSTRAVHTSAEFSVLVSDTANILVTSSYCVLVHRFPNRLYNHGEGPY